MIPEASMPRRRRKAADWPALRDDSLSLGQKVHGQPLIYFDNAATTQKPRVVLEALRHYYEHDNANVHRGIHELSNRATAGFEAARARGNKSTRAHRPKNFFHARRARAEHPRTPPAGCKKHNSAGYQTLPREETH